MRPLQWYRQQVAAAFAAPLQPKPPEYQDAGTLPLYAPYLPTEGRPFGWTSCREVFTGYVHQMVFWDRNGCHPQPVRPEHFTTPRALLRWSSIIPASVDATSWSSAEQRRVTALLHGVAQSTAARAWQLVNSQEHSFRIPPSALRFYQCWTPSRLCCAGGPGYRTNLTSFWLLEPPAVWWHSPALLSLYLLMWNRAVLRGEPLPRANLLARALRKHAAATVFPRATAEEWQAHYYPYLCSWSHEPRFHQAEGEQHWGLCLRNDPALQNHLGIYPHPLGPGR